MLQRGVAREEHEVLRLRQDVGSACGEGDAGEILRLGRHLLSRKTELDAELDETVVANTLGAVIKYREDGKRIEQHGIADLVKQGVKQAFEKGLAHG